MNFIGMLTEKIARGSGYAEILIEAKLVTSVTVFSMEKIFKSSIQLERQFFELLHVLL